MHSSFELATPRRPCLLAFKLLEVNIVEVLSSLEANPLDQVFLQIVRAQPTSFEIRVGSPLHGLEECFECGFKWLLYPM